MSYSLAQILVQLRDQKLQFAPDTMASLLLAAAEQCLDGRGAELGSVLLESGGSITVHPAPGGSTIALASLKTALSTAVEHASDRHRYVDALSAADCVELVSALRAALVPLNRPAARRTLARLFRELERSGLAAAPAIPPFTHVPEARVEGEARHAVAPVEPPPVTVAVHTSPLVVAPPPLVDGAACFGEPPGGWPTPQVLTTRVAPVTKWPETPPDSRTPLLATLGVAPHARSRVPNGSLTAAEDAELTQALGSRVTHPVEPLSALEAGDHDEYTVPVPSAREAPWLALGAAVPPATDDASHWLDEAWVEVDEASHWVDRPSLLVDDSTDCAELDASVEREGATPWAPETNAEAARSEPDVEAARSEPDVEAARSEPDLEAVWNEPDAEAQCGEPTPGTAFGHPDDGDAPAAFAVAGATRSEPDVEAEPLFDPGCVEPTPEPLDGVLLQALAEVTLDERTSAELATVDREPGLGRIESKRSELDELLRNFRVSEGVPREVVLAVLERSVASHGTPLPPSVRPAEPRVHSR